MRQTGKLYGNGGLMSERGKPLTFIEPKWDCLYVYMDARPQLSKIIVTTENSQQITEVGTVMAVGPKVEDGYKPGDRIVIHYFTGIHLQLPECYSYSQYHRIIRDHEILFKINQEERDKFNEVE
jgi:co-chaperonin GroES (HSP10)